MYEKIGEILITNGPLGITAAIVFAMYWQERKDHAETRRDHSETRKLLFEMVGRYDDSLKQTAEAMTKVTMLVSERLPNRNAQVNGGS